MIKLTGKYDFRRAGLLTSGLVFWVEYEFEVVAIRTLAKHKHLSWRKAEWSDIITLSRMGKLL